MYLVTLLGGASCLNADLNDWYWQYLSGEQPMPAFVPHLVYLLYEPVHTPGHSMFRFQIFEQTLHEIIAHNKLKLSWTKGINDFTDLTWEEFRGLKLMAPQNCSATEHNLKVKSNRKLSAPSDFDWRSKGMVSPVKNQGACGSCWTFSTVGAIESHWNILRKGRNDTFAEQQLVDCAQAFDNHGCNGGLPSHAFEYIKYAPGLMRSSDYPYTAKDGQCQFNKTLARVQIPYGSFNITAGNEIEAAERLYNAAPVSVAFQVVQGFKDYKSGVYTSSTCKNGNGDVNHAVLAVGYGKMDGKDFWAIKNSWGQTWGDNGYFKMERGKNMCGVAQCNSYPLIDGRQLDDLEASQ
ncbi:LOW QUALITY PROTEIN: uncharacterized protein LOC127594963 [Hippocampus zosterae]|uniref:LOW QUALITY PROTEIN: uncharacterized protein LOC127594963 n=1 Tax=Hippocampus zosterae TaxID=109293 RepID=UPI00223C91B9|nr:LOW QUALITY PROTEIN: uncharacterized protein LOC127594963 [Hippocampus zosterae]